MNDHRWPRRPGPSVVEDRAVVLDRAPPAEVILGTFSDPAIEITASQSRVQQRPVLRVTNGSSDLGWLLT